MRFSVLLLALIALPAHALNSLEPGRETRASSPAYPDGNGPIVLVDEAHFNFHTISGRYRSFARTLDQDGYRVRPCARPCATASLGEAGILVIATALSGRNRDMANWSPPIASAFTPAEIQALKEWVRDGGSLLLIADHLPFAGAAEKLAAAFGFELINGYALDRREIRKASLDRPFVFAREARVPRDGALKEHAITRGRYPAERVESVMTFLGAGFRARLPADPLLVLGEQIRSYLPKNFGKLSVDTPSVPADGMLQGAAKRHGKGRVVFYSEAGMFGEQWQKGKPVGMNHPGAGDNLQLLLNTMHWLDGSLN